MWNVLIINVKCIHDKLNQSYQFSQNVSFFNRNSSQTGTHRSSQALSPFRRHVSSHLQCRSVNLKRCSSRLELRDLFASCYVSCLSNHKINNNSTTPMRNYHIHSDIYSLRNVLILSHLSFQSRFSLQKYFFSSMWWQSFTWMNVNRKKQYISGSIS